MPAPNYLSRHLLIAMPALADPNFARGVTLICQHNEEGAMGLTINRPSDWRLGDVMAQVGIEHAPPELAERRVLLGGPVQGDRGFVLHEPSGTWDSSAKISADLVVTTSRDILQAIAERRGPERFLVLLGYAGWSAGQLEEEVKENAWLTAEPADTSILFDLPLEQRWDAAARLLGVDIRLLGGVAGHA
ncbi:MAG: YqgE/AlgH family protein [Xanthomonadales bacterium]|nr:YqgE/AlgH family protein [Xanthomonadales bacterium]